MEAPLAPQNKVIIDKEYSYSYRILDTGNIIDNSTKLDLAFPEEINDYIQIGNVDFRRDEVTENEIITEYPNNAVKDLRVYEIICTYKILQKKRIVFQPTIILSNQKSYHELIPFDPICFFDFK